MIDIKDLAIAMHKERSRGLAHYLKEIDEALSEERNAVEIIEEINDWLPELLAVPWVKELLAMEQPSIALLQEIDERIDEIEKAGAA